MTGFHFEVLLANGTVVNADAVQETTDSGSLSLLNYPPGSPGPDAPSVLTAVTTLAPGVWLAYRRVNS